jgi:uncharacterized protein with von Willebrand factor type A (vWA) domain
VTSRTGVLIGPVVLLSRRLRTRGVRVSPVRVESAIRALEVVDARNVDDAYWAVRCCLISSVDDVKAFDQAFAEFWGGQATPGMVLERPPSRPQSRNEGTEGGQSTTEESVRLGGGNEEKNDRTEGHDPDVTGVNFSARERLRSLEFADWDSEDLTAGRSYLEEIAKSLPVQRSRRLRSSNQGQFIDRRATMRQAMRTEGHPLELLTEGNRTKPRKLCFIVDVSGSMEPYARPLIVFCQAVRRVSKRVEIFSLGTRLTRLTGQLGERDPSTALENATSAVPDWAGGTRIGENLRTLNIEWGRRGVTRGAVVIIYSDGWERGGVELLSTEMARLKRKSSAIVWVNPLAGEAGYEPLAAGMTAALPYLDAFLPGHDLNSLESLVKTINALQQGPGRIGYGKLLIPGQSGGFKTNED